ncbi:MAG TPA: TraR/DksA C4-type zinc finger protein [Acidimicrobiia bacterium]|nr:TraR/DksA C4-type zinc finger protein [Acidimicrobiia bacterium]
MATRLEAAPAAVTHLSPAQLDRLRALLLDELGLQESRALELQDAPDIEPDLAGVLLLRCQEAIEEIEEALRLFDDGAYGRCSGCAAEISYERLEAVPAAQRCVSCQSGRERLPR